MNAILELQQYIITRLRSSQDLLAILGGPRIHDDPPRKLTPPHIALGETIHVDWSTDTEMGLEHTIRLELWSDKNGRKQIIQMADQIQKLLDEERAELGLNQLVSLSFESLKINKDRYGDHFKGSLDLRAVTEPLST